MRGQNPAHWSVGWSPASLLPFRTQGGCPFLLSNMFIIQRNTWNQFHDSQNQFWNMPLPRSQRLTRQVRSVVFVGLGLLRIRETWTQPDAETELGGSMISRTFRVVQKLPPPCHRLLTQRRVKHLRADPVEKKNDVYKWNSIYWGPKEKLKDLSDKPPDLLHSSHLCSSWVRTKRANFFRASSARKRELASSCLGSRQKPILSCPVWLFLVLFLRPSHPGNVQVRVLAVLKVWMLVYHEYKLATQYRPLVSGRLACSKWRVGQSQSLIPIGKQLQRGP